MKRTFVYVAAGDRYVETARLSIAFLKAFSKNEILVIRCRSTESLDHDQVIDAHIPATYTDHQASILIKTGLHHYLGDLHPDYCYLDNDVIAVSDQVDTIFECRSGPVSFAPDHVRMDAFSRFAVRCGCAAGRCHHLSDAIKATFDVEVDDPQWQHWNGGVFLFNAESAEFLELWHRYTRRVLAESHWQTRDQGTLIAAVWKLGLQRQATLPHRFNYIVDRMNPMPHGCRATAGADGNFVDTSYSLRPAADRPNPVLLHFINDGVGRRGWKNWDDAAALLTEPGREATQTQGVREPERRVQPEPSSGTLTEDNRIVHGMWIGKHLSKLELLTMHSFLGNGHEFHLWAYDDIETRLPDGVVLQDANEIIPRESIFTKRGWDSESGVGRGSFGAFSDLFRYKLLYEKGGYWADMDITCLKPLDFSAEYLFRSHRVGVVGNLMKCPRGSRLMLETYEETARTASPDSPWLMTNRVLSANVNRLGLSGFVRTDICNQDSWLQVVKLLIEKPVRIPDAWYAIHWVNEFWRTITESNGYYRGKKVVEYVPDKNHARAGSTLAGLYQKYGMLDAERLLPGTAPSEASLTAPSEAALTAPSEVPPSTESATQKAPPKAVLNRPADRQPVTPQIRRDRHVNILITSMALGGAERIVHEILMGLAPHKPTSKLFVMYQANPSYPVEDSERMRVFSLASLDEDRMVRTVALEVLASPHRVLYTHMVPARLLRRLGDYGVRVVPVIHNSQPSWQDPADAFDHPNIPFVVAVSDAVAEQMRAQSCPAPVVTIRHELHRWFTPEELQANRDRIRGQYGIRGNTILIGMVGQFKLQKAYTRAARVLQQIQERHPAKLMILGGWDHAHGAGRAAYTAFCRQALELGIMPDVITPGSVHPVEPYYAAFDVFLNTSMYEGLSIAMLEAIQCGCPVVTADAGGNREVLSPTSALVKDAADIDAYVNALWPLIEERQRTVPRKPGYPDLIPCLWQLLARYGVPDPQERSDTRTGTLFVAGNINLGGPQRSLMNLLSLLSAQHRCALGVLDQVYSAEYLQAIEQAGAAVFSVHTASGMLERAERLLHMIESLHVRNVCFWNAPTPIKLLLTKVLHQRAIRLIDVSPGPMLFDEMAGAETFQRRICLTDAQYFRRLDRFVAKYTSGTVPPCVADVREKTVVIPNGVPEVASSESIPEVALPEGVHPEFVIGTCCRIVPSKQIEFLIDVMRSLTPAVPQASLVIVGGVDPFHIPYWNDLCKYLEESGLQNIHFVGGKADVRPYLQRFKVFVMISANQGCPNASLEAMMMGLPVVANANGGTGEQVRHGVNGYLVSDADPTDMGRRVASLLSDPKLRAVLGAAGRKIAHTEFSMEQMVARYREILESD